MASGWPAATLASAAVVVSTWLLVGLGRGWYRVLSLLPGHTVLGEHHVWNVATHAWVEPNLISMLTCLAAYLALGWKGEVMPVGSRLLPSASAWRVAAATGVGVVAAGVATSFGVVVSVATSVSDTDVTPVLYLPIHGCGPLLAVAAVTAWQVQGHAAVLPHHLPWLQYNHMPLAVVVATLLRVFIFRVSRDLATTCLALLLSWLYLRYLHAYAAGSVGDTRHAFAFTQAVPRVPVLSQLTAVATTATLVACKLVLPASLFQRVTGDGLSFLPDTAPPGTEGPGADAGVAAAAAWYGTALSGAASSLLGRTPASNGVARGASATATNPLAEHKRERVLAALDRRLADMRRELRGGGLSSPLGSGRAAVLPGGSGHASAQSTPAKLSVLEESHGGGTSAARAVLGFEDDAAEPQPSASTNAASEGVAGPAAAV